MELTTKRLRIIPLNLERFSLLLDAPDRLRDDLGLQARPAKPEGHTLDAMRWLYEMASTHPDDFPWYANWQIILASAGLPIGSACFKGGPDAEGEVEIGYGIDGGHRNQGYMTEAAGALCDWALRQERVASVKAETDKDNMASRCICEKTGMAVVGETASTLIWQKKSPPTMVGGDD